jgi:hypothetical protein
MIANPKKSVTMSISNIHNNFVPEAPIFTMNGEQISNETSTKFLGVIIDEHLTFKDHVDHVIKKTRGLVYSLLDLKRSGVPTHIMRKFYTTCIRPIILYACPSWYSFTTGEQRLRLVRLENLALKIMDPSSQDYDERVQTAEIVPILTLLEDTSKSYINRIMGSPEHCLHQLAHSYTPAAPPRRSARLDLPIPPSTRTELRSKCPLIFYHNV